MVRSASADRFKLVLTLSAVASISTYAAHYIIDLGLPTALFWLLILLWQLGTRKKWGSDRTASAYSVFNEGEKRILGTFHAEQFEQQLRGGGISHRKDLSQSTGALRMKREQETRKSSRQSDPVKDQRRKAAADAAIRRRRNYDDSIG